MKHITIRELKKSDFEKGFADVMKIINPAETTIKSLTRLIKLRDTYTYVVEEYYPRRIVGTGTLIVCYKHGGHLGFIEDVAILPECERKYYGTHLIKYMLKEADRIGCYKVVLLCKDGNVEFYEKTGMDKYQNCMCKKFIRL
jgi:glucosamine-phosphate N-acetyltransferase